MPPIRPEPRLASFSVRVAVSWPWARVPCPCCRRTVAPPDEAADAPVGIPVADLTVPRFVVNPNTVTMKTPRTSTHAMISSGPLPARSSTKGLR